jgi:hypothetical protein
VITDKLASYPPTIRRALPHPSIGAIRC